MPRKIFPLQKNLVTYSSENLLWNSQKLRNSNLKQKIILKNSLENQLWNSKKLRNENPKQKIILKNSLENLLWNSQKLRNSIRKQKIILKNNLLKNLHYVYMENTHNGQKRRKTEHISVNNSIYVLTYSIGRVELSQKTISRYCLF